MSRIYTVGSLFSGIGGIELGLESCGRYETRWFAEADPFCREVIGRNWKGRKIYEDVKDVKIEDAVERVDVVCGGFPCQDVSTAGKGAGIRGKRTGIFYTAIDIVDKLRPACVILENVTGILSNGFGRLLQAFQEIRYDVEWNCVSAESVGYPHKRERIFIIAYPTGVRLPRPWTLGKPVDPEESKYREAGEFVNAFQRKDLPYLCAKHDGLDRSTSVAVITALGNSVVPDAAMVAGKRAVEVLDFGSNYERAVAR